MTYKTYNCNSFKVHTIKSDKFKTAHMEVIFRKNAVKEELCSYSFLADILSESTKNYPSKRDLIIKFEELYRASIYATTVKTGNVLNTEFITDFINPEYIKDKNYLEEVIKLSFEVIGNPNVVNDEFLLKPFNLVKERLKREINSIKENPVKLAIRGAIDLFDSESPTSYKILGTIEDLEEITPASLYKTYRKLMKENTCDIFIIGNLDMDEVVTLIKKYFKNRYINELDLKIPVTQNLRKKEIIGSDNSDNIQATLVMLFNVTDLTEKEKNVTFQTFNYIFGSGGLTSKLYQSIREKNSLCYGISSMYLKSDSLLLVQVSLDNENVKKAISLVKKELKNMQNGVFTDMELEDAKKNLMISLDLAYDNNVSIVNNYVFNVFDNLPMIDERKKMYKDITKEDVIAVSKKIKINTIYTLNGREAK